MKRKGGTEQQQKGGTNKNTRQLSITPSLCNLPNTAVFPNSTA